MHVFPGSAPNSPLASCHSLRAPSGKNSAQLPPVGLTGSLQLLASAGSASTSELKSQLSQPKAEQDASISAQLGAALMGTVFSRFPLGGQRLFRSALLPTGSFHRCYSCVIILCPVTCSSSQKSLKDEISSHNH